MRNVEQDQDARELALPSAVQEALGELVNDLRASEVPRVGLGRGQKWAVRDLFRDPLDLPL
jgi:hypothetical protein